MIIHNMTTTAVATTTIRKREKDNEHTQMAKMCASELGFETKRTFFNRFNEAEIEFGTITLQL